MKFIPTKLPGVVLIEIEPILDERGMFARVWCEQEFAQAGLSTKLSQFSISYNKSRGTLRGMHFQNAPHHETKLVRCTKGSAFDVAVDLRPESPTYKQWFGIELSALDHNMLYIPEGCAHGFITLEDDTEMLYQISEPYYAEAASGVRWNDFTFKIDWPFEPSVIADRDAQYTDYTDRKTIAKTT